MPSKPNTNILRVHGLTKFSSKFGGGSRTCIGRNISLLEITKVVPQIVRNFDIEFEHPGKPMESRCAWFVYPKYNGFFKLRASD